MLSLLASSRRSLLKEGLARAFVSSSRCAAVEEVGPGVEQPRHPLPPFTMDTALEKVQKAEDAWNSKDPERVAEAYTPDSKWRNRGEVFEGRDAIKAFLKRKWKKEHGYRLKKELWSYTGNRIAVKFEYEWHDEKGNWTRSYGCELWDFAMDGRMAERHASINDAPVQASELRVAQLPKNEEATYGSAPS